MKAIEALSKVYYAPLKRNCLVSTSVASAYERVEALAWTNAETTQGKLVHIKKFPKGHQVKLFRIASDSGRTEYIATNDLSQCEVSEAMRQECRLRWKIEQLHRELKQTTGIGDQCQSRQHRAQRNHIACCLWVWVSLTRAARAARVKRFTNSKKVYSTITSDNNFRNLLFLSILCKSYFNPMRL